MDVWFAQGRRHPDLIDAPPTRPARDLLIWMIQMAAP